MIKEEKQKLKYINTTDKRRVLVAGDIHGDYESLRNILGKFNSDEDILVFLGDYADRGENGTEVINKVYDLVKQYQNEVIALKGNHEDYAILCLDNELDNETIVVPKFKPCTLKREVNQKFENPYDFWCQIFKPFLDKTYLAAIISNEILFVHGGVSRKIKDINSLMDPEKKIEEDVLWSDPFDGIGEKTNPRGYGVLFGNGVSDYVCKKLNVRRIVRSHEPRKAREGPYVEHDGRVITTSATQVYGGKPFLLEILLNNTDEVFENLRDHVIFI